MTTPNHPAVDADRAPRDDAEPPPTIVVPPTYRRDWTLFTDWCTAHDLNPLPASTIAVARFLDFEPRLAPATKRRRVTAINHTHTAAGHSAPGTVTAIRRLLSERDHHTTRAHHVITELPTVGWPAGLFGRRDALLITLTCILGLPIGTAAALRCGDLTHHPDTSTVIIGGGHDITVPATTDPHGPYAVWRRWAALRDRMIRLPSPRAWTTALTAATPIAATSPPYAPINPAATPPPPHDPAAMLFPALDRWGQPRHPGITTPMSERAAADTIATALHGTPRRYTAPAPHPDTHRPNVPAFTAVHTENTAPLRDPAVDGAAARRRAISELSALDTVYTDIDTRTQQLLDRTEALLRQWSDLE